MMLEIYHNSIPNLLKQLAQTPEMLRLREVGMHCGCEYTDFPRFRHLRPYSRYTHSLGVGCIVWHFTEDPAQAAAGPLHDLATPTFAHVVDFLRGDYLTQEATEDGTRSIIHESPEIQSVLRAFGLCTNDVCDYHRYPIADNDAPKLSADRLEYTLGNLQNFGLGTAEEAAALYRDLTVGTNEAGEPELVFRSAEAALRFAEVALACAEVYVCDEDRFAMQMLAELLRDAIAAGALTEQDLMGGEPALIAKLTADPLWGRRWQAYRSMQALEHTAQPEGAGWRKIDAKRRCIDPMVLGRGRVSLLYPDFACRLQRFRTKPLDLWLRAK